MNDFTDIVFIFIFVFVITYYDIVNIRTNNIIVQKILICLGVFVFTFVLELLKSTNTHHSVNIGASIARSILTAMSAFIGHTLLIDLGYIDATKECVDILHKISCPEVAIGLFVVFGITIGRSIKHLFAYPCNAHM